MTNGRAICVRCLKEGHYSKDCKLPVLPVVPPPPPPMPECCLYDGCRHEGYCRNLGYCPFNADYL